MRGTGLGGLGRLSARFSSLAATSTIGLSAAGGRAGRRVLGGGGRTGRARLVRCLVPLVVSG